MEVRVAKLRPNWRAHQSHRLNTHDTDRPTLAHTTAQQNDAKRTFLRKIVNLKFAQPKHSGRDLRTDQPERTHVVRVSNVALMSLRKRHASITTSFKLCAHSDAASRVFASRTTFCENTGPLLDQLRCQRSKTLIQQLQMKAAPPLKQNTLN